MTTTLDNKVESARVESAAGFRLSPQQQRIWSLAAGEGARPGFDAPAHLRLEIEGRLDPRALEGALGDLFSRHEILRTDVRCPPGLRIPAQLVRPPAPIEFTHRDLRKRVGASESRELPLTARLDRLASHRWTLSLNLSAYRADAPTLAEVGKRLSVAYAARRGAAPRRDDDGEEMQYADLAEWQSGLLEDEEGRRFWEKRTAGEEALSLRLPAELPAAAAGNFALGEESVTLAGPEAVDELARRLATSTQAVLLALWATLLSRLTGRAEIHVACYYDGRSYEELAGALGPLERYLPVRVPTAPRRRFSELAGRLEESLEELYDWQEYYAPAVGAILPCAFRFEETAATWEAAGARFRLARHHSLSEPFVACLDAVRRDDLLELTLLYDAGRLTPSAAGRLAEELGELLRKVTADPERPVAEYDVVGGSERRLLTTWSVNSEGGRIPPEDAIRRFERRVAESGGRAAVICGGVTWSYRELDEAANRLARQLLHRGVSPETRVAIYLERSLELVAAILGVMKAGGVFMPLDPSYPRERNQRVLEGSNAGLLVSCEKLADKLPAEGPELLLLEEVPGGAAVLTGVEVAPHSLAYLLFTSGSTGAPKGVMLSRGGLARYLEALSEVLEIGRDDVYLHSASFAFSSSVRHLLVPLTRGAAVVLTSGAERGAPHHILGLVGRHQATTLDLVPSVWRSLLEAAEQGGPHWASLRLALSASEALPPDVARHFFDQAPAAARFFNMYGHTETTGIVAACSLDPSDTEPGSSPPLGRPLPGLRVFAFDRRLRFAPVGSPGEIFVGGESLGRGYFAAPALTAERFVPDSQGGEPGCRLYRTGDLGTFGADGRLRHLGRTDHQIKIRGVRVERGEVEVALLEHPGVACCAVGTLDGGSVTELAAYVVPEAGSGLEGLEIRRFLEERLPSFMVPSKVMFLDELPRTPNEKIDYRSLPTTFETSARSHVPPAGPLEEKLAEIWCEVLEVERVSRDDDFFELGGHSMRGILVMSRIQDHYDVEIPAYRLFETRTLRELALLVEEQQLAQALREVGDLSDDEVRNLLTDQVEE